MPPRALQGIRAGDGAGPKPLRSRYPFHPVSSLADISLNICDPIFYVISDGIDDDWFLWRPAQLICELLIIIALVLDHFEIG